MTFKNSNTHYGSVSKFIHWLTAFAVIGMLAFGWWMGTIDKSLDYRWTAYDIHKQIGLAVLIISLLRILWMTQNPHPDFPSSMPWFERLAARTGHLFLYLAIVFMPLSGWLMSTAANHIPTLFGIALPFPGMPVNKAIAHFFAEIHEWLAWFIVAGVALHALAALKHHFIDKNNVLRRMLPGKD